MKRVIIAALAALVAVPASAPAVPIGFEFNAGPVLDIPDRRSSLADVFDEFVLGEEVIVAFLLDSETPDSDDRASRGLFLDPLGSIMFTGATSGASFTTFGGVAVEIDSRNEFDLSSFFEGPLPEGGFELFNDIDVGSRPAEALVTNPDDLAGSITELATLFADGSLSVPNTARQSTGGIRFLNRRGRLRSTLEFGSVSAVPLPPALPLLAGALALLAYRARKRA